MKMSLIYVLLITAIMNASGCQNKHKNSIECDRWASEGECEANPLWMIPNCQKSCLACDKPIPTQAPATTPAPDIGNCTDKHDTFQCLNWARAGECDKNPTWMVPNCQRSCGNCSLSGSGAMSREKLTKDLLENYIKSVKPEPSDGSRFNVTLGVTLLSLDDVDDENRVIETHSYVDQRWRDERLAWEPSDYDDVRFLHLPADSIWIPDVVLFNNAGDDYKPMIDMTVLVSSDGTINYIPPYHLKSFCETGKQPTGVSNKMNIDRYTELVCKLTFLSWMYNGEEMNLVNRSPHIDMTDFRRFPADKFQVKSTSVQVDPKKFPCCPESYDIATFTIVLSNDPKYHHDSAPMTDDSP